MPRETTFGKSIAGAVVIREERNENKLNNHNASVGDGVADSV